MPLNKTKRPDRTYVPQKMPDYTRYQNLEAERKPPAAVMVDNDLNSLVDYGNYLADAIDNVEAGAIAGADDEDNANKVVTTNGEVISWVSITDENIEEGGITDVSIAQNAITGGADGSIGLGTITDENIAANTINLNKLKNTLNFASALVTYNNAALGVGQTRFTEFGQVLAYTPSLTSGPRATKLDDVWNVIPNNTCVGGKISVGTIPGDRMVDLAITTDKLAVSAVTYEKIAPRTIQADRIAMLAITSTEINVGSIIGDRVADGAISNSKIADNTITINKLNQSLSRLTPFSMANIIDNSPNPATIGITNLNIASVTRVGAGIYNIVFATAAANTQYVILLTADSEHYGSVCGVCYRKRLDGFQAYFHLVGVGDISVNFSYIVFSF